ncbi:hypothetical protein [Deinococcus sp. UYEF24]
MADINKFFDKAFADKELDELADAPVSALNGVSEADGEALQKAFNIKTVRDLAENKFVLIAQGIAALSSKKK